RPNGVERMSGGDTEPPPLSRRVTPVSLVPSEAAASRVDDRPRRYVETAAAEELTVVVAGEEARLLALGPLGNGKSRCRCLAPDIGLGTVAERKPQTVELGRLQRGEHVGLVLRVVVPASEQPLAAVLDDARVVPGRKL